MPKNPVKQRLRWPLAMVAGLVLCAFLGAVWPGEAPPAQSPPTSWRRTAQGWQKLDTRLLSGKPTIRSTSPGVRVHPLSLATFQLVASVVGLVGARRLSDESSTEGSRRKNQAVA